MSYRAHQRKLLPAIARSYALMLAQNDLVEMMHEVAGHEGGAPEEHQRELEARAAGIKAVATRHATDTIQMCREACGGAGYMADNRLTDLKADTDVFTTFEGDNTVLLQLVAKGLLTEFQETFEDNSPLAMIAFASRFTASSILEKTPAAGLISRLMARAPSTDDDDAERHRGRQLALFVDREKHLLEGVALRLAKAAKAEPADAFRIFNNAQDHLLAAAEAHIDRVLLEAMCAAVEACEEGPVAELLDDVTDLFALSTIERHRGLVPRARTAHPTASKRVIRSVGVLCKDLAPHARGCSWTPSRSRTPGWAHPSCSSCGGRRRERAPAHAGGRSAVRRTSATAGGSPTSSPAARTSTGRRGWPTPLVPRGARILDAGAGMGRVTAALRSRGHDVTGIEPDRALVDQAERTYPGIGLLPLDILEVAPGDAGGRRRPHGVRPRRRGRQRLHPARRGHRAACARRSLRSVLAPGGRILVGFHLTGGPAGQPRLPAGGVRASTSRPPDCASTCGSAATTCARRTRSMPCGCSATRRHVPDVAESRAGADPRWRASRRRRPSRWPASPRRRRRPGSTTPGRRR